MPEDRSQPVDRRFGRGGLVGTVRTARTVSERSGGRPDGEPRTVLRLELAPLEPAGAPPVAVSFPAPDRAGGVTRGDVVEVAGRVRDDVLHARRMFNHTTGLTVASTSRRGQLGPLVFVGALGAGLIALVVLSLLSMTGVLSREPTREDLFEKAREQCYQNSSMTRDQCDKAFDRK